MTLELQLSLELEQRLTREARQVGLPVEQYALRLLSDSAPDTEPARSGQELVAFWRREGIVGSRADIEDSQVHARRLRSRSESRVKN